MKEFDVGRLFVQNLLNIEQKLVDLMNRELPINLTDEDREIIANATHCSYCGNEIKGKGVKDHGK